MERAYIVWTVIRASLIIAGLIAAYGFVGWIETGGN